MQPTPRLRPSDTGITLLSQDDVHLNPAAHLAPITDTPPAALLSAEKPVFRTASMGSINIAEPEELVHNEPLKLKRIIRVRLVRTGVMAYVHGFIALYDPR